MLVFAYPALCGLLLLPLLVRWLVPPFREARLALRIPFFERLAAKLDATPTEGSVVRHRGWPQAIAFFSVWAAVVLGLARPQWLEPPLSREVPTRDLLLAVDISGSMDTRDFTTADGRTVDRLTAAKEVLDEFLTRRRGDRVGLIVFGSAPFVQAPFTEDLDALRRLLQATTPRMAGPKTALGDAIGLAITLFARSALPRRTLIVLTDGNDTDSLVPPLEAARLANDERIVIHTVAVGDPTAAGEEKLDETTLRRMAETTGGRFFAASDRAALGEVYATLDALEPRIVQTVRHRPRRELFPWPLGLALALSFVQPAVLAWQAHRQAAAHRQRQEAAA
jgi:Ca-activated chloride channel family protein